MELRSALGSRGSHRWVWFAALPGFLMLPAPSLGQHPHKTLGRWSMTRDWQIPGTHLALLHGPDTSSVVVALPSEGGGELEGKYFAWRRRSDTAVFHPPSHPLDRVEVTPPVTFTNMFCAGHSPLPDGRLLVTGGSEGVQPQGSWHAYVFDPRRVPMDSLSWTPAPVMTFSRYYPTNLTMADGRVMVFSGSTYAHALSFAGTDESSFRNDLQLNAGLDSTLISSTASTTLQGTAPSPRAFHGAIFDPGPAQDGSNIPGYPYLGRAVIFGGRDNGGVLNGVWALTRDERRNRWSATLLSPVSDSTYGVPAPRERPAVALEMTNPLSVGSRMFVYGGADGSGQALGDCWELGLGQGGTTIGAWKRVISGGGPGRRVGHTIAAIIKDDVTRVIVVGGRLGSQTGALSDTVWALNIPDGGPPAWNVMRVGGPQR